jgi:soluble lytic murein transglycosylase-like protein
MRRLVLTIALLVLALPSVAAAHVVQPGQTLWGIASANGLSTATLAAANGLSPEAHVISGTTLTIPAAGQSTTTTPVAGSSVGGGRVVQPGESLSSVAAANGISVAALAGANGLSPTSFLIAGNSIRIPSASAASYVPAAQTTPVAATGTNPQTTNERVSVTKMGDYAQEFGMSRSLVQAVGWQESGFNNALTSSAGARGVMQIMPGTWDFIQQNLAGNSLNPASAADNVRAGTLYLRHLYRIKGGDPRQTIGSYYQGPNRATILPETEQYIQSVLGHKQGYMNWQR